MRSQPLFVSPLVQRILLRSLKPSDKQLRSTLITVSFHCAVDCTDTDETLCSAEPLTEEQLAEKEELIAKGFEDWSRRDFQQFIRALETYGW